mgnify:CR=1 FL=1
MVRIDDISRPMRDGDMREIKKTLPAMPGGHSGEGIVAYQQHQWTFGTAGIGAAQAFQRRYGETRYRGINFGRIKVETWVSGDRQAHHIEPLAWANAGYVAQGGLSGGYPAHTR